jgi:hypothetical protein
VLFATFDSKLAAIHKQWIALDICDSCKHLPACDLVTLFEEAVPLRLKCRLAFTEAIDPLI